MELLTAAVRDTDLSVHPLYFFFLEKLTKDRITVKNIDFVQKSKKNCSCMLGSGNSIKSD